MSRLLYLFAFASCWVILVPASTAVAAGSQPDAVWLERFNGTDLHALGWEGGQERQGKKDHFIVHEKGHSFVRSDYIPGTEAKYISKEVEWNCHEYPYLRWKWRVEKFPVGAKILEPKRSDAPAQIYVLWKTIRRVSVIKYFWAATEKVGLSFNQSNFFFGRLYGLIIRSDGPANVWHTETRNVVEDFKKGFGDDPPGKVRGIALLSDGDQTNTPSAADYTDFEILKSPGAPASPAAAKPSKGK